VGVPRDAVVGEDEKYILTGDDGDHGRTLLRLVLTCVYVFAKEHAPGKAFGRFCTPLQLK